MKNANKRPAVKHDGVDSIDGEQSVVGSGAEKKI